MKTCVLFVAAAATGHAMAISPLTTVLLVAVGVLVTCLACAVIVGIVRLAGRQSARLLVRNGDGRVQRPGR